MLQVQNDVIPGICNKASNTISRHPTGDTHPLKMHLHDDISAVTQPEQPLLVIEPVTHMDSITSLLSLHVINWNKVWIASASDANMTLLSSTIEGGIPEHRQDMPDSLRIYHLFQEHLSTLDGVILYKDCIVIPPSLKPNCLTELLAAHHGTSAMIAKAESSTSALVSHWASFKHAMAATTAIAWPLPNLYPHSYHPHRPYIPSNASVQIISNMEAITTLSLSIATLIGP